MMHTFMHYSDVKLCAAKQCIRSRRNSSRTVSRLWGGRPENKTSIMTTHLYSVSTLNIEWSHTFTPPCVFMSWCLIKPTENVYLQASSLRYEVVWIGILLSRLRRTSHTQSSRQSNRHIITINFKTFHKVFAIQKDLKLKRGCSHGDENAD